ncbi:MAG: protein translocase subunit SecF [Candidatus Wallbacteria bacterium]
MKKIDFLSYRYIAYALSIISFIATIILVFTPGIQYGVDFKGGTELLLRFSKPVDDETIRKVLKDDCKLNYIIVQSVFSNANAETNAVKANLTTGQSTDKLIKTDFLAEKPMIDPETKKEVKTVKEVKEKITAALQAKDKELTIKETLSEVSVGPSIGQELRNQAAIAVMIALIGILAYVTYQFEFKFALSSIIALFHDVIITIGFIILTGKEMDMIQLTVLLTVVGYSINDTIIICDRVRENYRIMKKVKYYDLVNESLAQVFSRTVITVLTTELPLIAMYIYGGEVLSAFASSMIFGTVIGCFSSIYVVSPMIVAWKEYEEKVVA